LELGIQSRNELVLEMATEMGLNRMGEDDNEDDDDEGDATEDTAPPHLLLPHPLPPPLRLLPRMKKTQRC
jgi:hypothetical protein